MKTLHATNPLMRGPDVEKVQRLLAAAGYRLDVDGVFGPATIAAVLDAKRRLGYPAAQRKPIAGDQFVRTLRDAQKPLVKAPTRRNARAKIVDYCRWAIEHEPAIHYAMVRPIPSRPRQLPMRTDCSGFVTLAYRDAGAADPNGSNYDGVGYTGTLAAHGRPITRAQARPGDLVFFGPFPHEHVCVVLEPGDDPLLASHGQERGPVAIRFAPELAYHRVHGNGQVTWRSYLP